MRKNPRFKTREAMDEHLDMQQNCFQALTCKHTNMADSSTLAELCDRNWSTTKLVDVYSETKFSKGFRDYLWYKNVMEASWDFNTDTYMEKRGFDMPAEEVDIETPSENVQESAKIAKRTHEKVQNIHFEHLKAWLEKDEEPHKDHVSLSVEEPIPHIKLKMKNQRCALLRRLLSRMTSLIVSVPGPAEKMAQGSRLTKSLLLMICCLNKILCVRWKQRRLPMTSSTMKALTSS